MQPAGRISLQMCSQVFKSGAGSFGVTGVSRGHQAVQMGHNASAFQQDADMRRGQIYIRHHPNAQTAHTQLPE